MAAKKSRARGPVLVPDSGPVMVPEESGPVIVPESDPEEITEEEAPVEEEEIPEGCVRFLGELFEVPERLNHRLLVRFGHMQRHPEKVTAEEASDIVDRMLDQLVDPEDRDRFEELCDEQRVSEMELSRFLWDSLAVIGERPTRRSSNSSAGPRKSKQRSGGDLYSQVIAREEDAGRPDRAQMVLLAREYHERKSPTTAWERMTS
jgi:hypothetical protein